MFRRIVFAFVLATAASSAMADSDEIGCLIRCLEEGVSSKSCAYICGG